MEIWKQIEGFEGKYDVSNLGNVYSHISNKVLTPKVKKGGYLEVNLQSTYHKIHRLVAKAFIEPVDGMDIVNHLDGNPANNRVDNLEWCNEQINAIHAIETGLGSNARPVINLETGIIYRSITQACKECHVGKATIAKYIGTKWDYIRVEGEEI